MRRGLLTIWLSIACAVNCHGAFADEQAQVVEAKVRREHATWIRECGRPRESLNWINHAIALDPNHPDGYSERCRTYQLLGKLDYAFADISRAIKLRLNDEGFHYRRALIAIEQKEWLWALADLNKVLELQPDYIPAYLHRATVHRMRREFTQALADLNHVVREKPKLTRAYLERGVLLTQMGDDVRAEASYDACLQLNGQDLNALVQRGQVRSRLGRKQDALDDFATALFIEPRCAAALYQRACLWGESRQWRGAFADLEQVMRTNRGYVASAHLKRAEFYIQLGDGAAAKRDVVACLSIRPEWTKKVEQRLLAAVRKRDGESELGELEYSWLLAP
ncbi:MAG: hypothetical protein QF805_17645 [Pirellulaceae bacterium]|jgi:tetratricopeptide (TPR) repeat protein|nr:hypothetical protein [Pirellulaceae bacterium]